MPYMPGICRAYADTFNIIFKKFKKDYSYICLVYVGHMPSIYNLLTYTALYGIPFIFYIR